MLLWGRAKLARGRCTLYFFGYLVGEQISKGLSKGSDSIDKDLKITVNNVAGGVVELGRFRVMLLHLGAQFADVTINTDS